MGIKTRTRTAVMSYVIGLAVTIFLPCLPMSGQQNRPVLDLPPAFQDSPPDTSPFLTRKGFGSSIFANDYYALVDPKRVRMTLAQWWVVNGFGPDGSGGVRTAYTNFNDLGFGRDMHCIENKTTGNVACYVTNYTKKSSAVDRRFASAPNRFVLQDPGNADLAVAASRTDFIATVCMEYSPVDGSPDPTKVVKFYVFAPDPKNPDIGASKRALSANLDDSQNPPDPNAFKFVPHLCLVCHGGTFQQRVADLGASFIGFDLETFRYSRAPGFSQAEQELAFKAQNLMVRDTNPAAATTELIVGWYHLDNVPIDVQDPAFVPFGWTDPPPGHVSLYNEVVKPGCRSCHAQQRSRTDQSISWSTFMQFQGARFTIRDLVCGATTKQMPHSYVTYLNFWRIGRPGPNELTQFLFDQGLNTICQ